MLADVAHAETVRPRYVVFNRFAIREKFGSKVLTTFSSATIASKSSLPCTSSRTSAPPNASLTSLMLMLAVATTGVGAQFDS